MGGLLFLFQLVVSTGCGFLKSRNPTLIDCSVSKQCPSPRHDVESFIDFLGIIGAEDGTSSAINADANARVYARRAGPNGAAPMSNASESLAGRRTLTWAKRLPNKENTDRLRKPMASSCPTRVLVVIPGDLHKADVAAAVKAKAKLLAT